MYPFLVGRYPNKKSVYIRVLFWLNSSFSCNFPLNARNFVYIFYIGLFFLAEKCVESLTKTLKNESFSTAERSERVENSLFRATREYTEAGIEQAIVAMRRLGANSPVPRKRAARE